MNNIDINSLPKTENAANKQFIRGTMTTYKRPIYIDLSGLKTKLFETVKKSFNDLSILESIKDDVYPRIIETAKNMDAFNIYSYNLGFCDLNNQHYSWEMTGENYVIRVNDKIVYYLVKITYIKLKLYLPEEIDPILIFEEGRKNDVCTPLIHIDI